jgi:hypothetical protein
MSLNMPKNFFFSLRMKGYFDQMTSEYFQISKIVATFVTMNTTLTVYSTELQTHHMFQVSTDEHDLRQCRSK